MTNSQRPNKPDSHSNPRRPTTETEKTLSTDIASEASSSDAFSEVPVKTSAEAFSEEPPKTRVSDEASSETPKTWISDEVSSETPKTRAGYIAIIGRPNVGKSTLMNALVGQKISITTRKPQTTRHRILGIHTTASTQMIFVDTPGIHEGGKRVLNRYMNRVAFASFRDVNAILWVVDIAHWRPDEDADLLKRLAEVETPVYLVMNKIDLVPQRGDLLPKIEAAAARYPFAAILPVSAKRGEQIQTLEEMLKQALPLHPFYYDPEQLSNRSDRFMCCELIREKLIMGLGQELPYRTTVTLDLFEETEGLVKVAAVIWVEKPNHKAIVIGQGGERLKRIATRARHALEEYFDKKVFLQVWVKVKPDWSDSERDMQYLGYRD